jgi:heat-inducible transcriptional repressor
MADAMGITGRDQHILRATILCYIKTAAPVGSRTLTKISELGLSPATIRNVMADLEEMGFLEQPHASAGRVPTEKAYRFYVDHLLGSALSAGEGDGLLALRFTPSEDVTDTLQEASRLLSLLSHYASVVVTPRFSSQRFRRVEFVRLGERQLLAIFVSEDGFIQHRRIEMDDAPSADQLRQIAEELNSRFRGQDLHAIRATLVEEMREHKHRYDQLMQQILDAAQGSPTQPPGDLYVEGKTNILDFPEFAETANMKALFKTFEEKYMMMTLIEKTLDGDGVRVFIGSENSALGVNNLSLVLANYRCGEHSYGTLGVLGPTRMEYDRVIPLVDQFARVLGELLTHPARADRAAG